MSANYASSFNDANRTVFIIIILSEGNAFNDRPREIGNLVRSVQNDSVFRQLKSIGKKGVVTRGQTRGRASRVRDYRATAGKT